MLRRTLIVGLAALSLGVAACGDDDDGGDAPDGGNVPAATAPPGAGAAGAGLSISADPDGQLAYTTTEVTAAAGPGQLTFVNDASVPHDVIVEQDGDEVAKTEVISESRETVEVDLEPGDYTFFCSVGGHREAGMEGTITAR